jgi:ribonuclease HI
MKTYECYFDGCCEPINPGGTMGFGVFIKSEEYEYRDSDNLPAKFNNTNNIAEYLAFTMLIKILKNKENQTIKIFGDSKLVIEQMLGKWKIKDGAYKPYALIAKPLFDELCKKNTVTLQWIPREENKEADKQSKMHLNMK